MLLYLRSRSLQNQVTAGYIYSSMALPLSYHYTVYKTVSVRIKLCGTVIRSYLVLD